MPIARPFKRTCRPFQDGDYASGGRSRYIAQRGYANSPEHYTRAYLLIQKDLLELFDFVEPAHTNLKTYSFRIHALFMRACMEFEANCKAVLFENGYQKKTDLNVTDFRKINTTHRLSSYSAKLPTWRGDGGVRNPYAGWNSESGLAWYRAYNASKHDRHEKFAEANLDNLLDAVTGLFVLISAQFYHYDFTGGISSSIITTEDEGEYEGGIGGYFQVRFPDDWPEAERYSFDYDSWFEAGPSFELLTFMDSL